MNRLKTFVAAAGMFLLFSCNNNQKEVDHLKEMVKQDSTLLEKAQTKDTIIAGYINTLGEIQDNLDSLKFKQKMLSMGASENTPDKKKSILADIKAIDEVLIKENKKIRQLEDRIRKMKQNDASLNKTIARLSQELAEKNNQIASLQYMFSQRGDSLMALTNRYNDTIVEITRQRRKLNALTSKFNTVYFIVGTLKQLKEKNIISKTGGLLGIGSTSEMNPNTDNSVYTKTDQTKLDSIPLGAKFSKIVTKHPASSYKITGDKKLQNLIISDPAAFWSESKYLVVMTK